VLQNANLHVLKNQEFISTLSARFIKKLTDILVVRKQLFFKCVLELLKLFMSLEMSWNALQTCCCCLKVFNDFETVLITHHWLCALVVFVLGNSRVNETFSCDSWSYKDLLKFFNVLSKCAANSWNSWNPWNSWFKTLQNRHTMEHPHTGFIHPGFIRGSDAHPCHGTSWC